MSATKSIKHYTASVFIFSDGVPRKTLLIHHRKHDKWNPPGGHQEAHENPIETAIREVREETGLDITAVIGAAEPIGKGFDLPLPQRMIEVRIPAHGDEPEHHHIDLQYHVVVPEQAVTHSPIESHDIGWFTGAELESFELFTDVRQTLQKELMS
jgi:8-oxo-dGTP pyrophosphatase MutT (NUDIX family)